MEKVLAFGAFATAANGVRMSVRDAVLFRQLGLHKYGEYPHSVLCLLYDTP